jgi:hypothetical protein
VITVIGMRSAGAPPTGLIPRAGNRKQIGVRGELAEACPSITAIQEPYNLEGLAVGSDVSLFIGEQPEGKIWRIIHR